MQAMCKGNCSVTGPYSAQRTTCTSRVDVALQDLLNRFPSRFLDLTCPALASAVLVPTLMQKYPALLPSFATAVSTPSWNNTPIAFPSTGSHSLQFTGLQTAQLLHGVQYQLDMTVLVFGKTLYSPPACDAVPLSYVSSTKMFSLSPCDTGLVALNFTQRCVACPPDASCNNTHIFAAAGSNVWRPSFDVLPFYSCLEGSRGCFAAEELLRIGNECAAGYAGPLCGICIDGYGRTGTGDCTPCFSTASNISVVILAAVFSFCVVTYVAVAATRTEHQDKDSSPLVLLGQQAVKLLTNHFSLFAVLVNTHIAASMRSEVLTILVVQQTATSPSPTQNSFVSCLFPHLTANDVFLVVLAVVLLLIAVEILIVRLARQQWAVASVSAAVLQLTYLEVIGSSSRLLHHVPMTFYQSTPYMAGNWSSTSIVDRLSRDVLVADVRVDFSANMAYYISAWLVLVVFGVGVPIWFCGVFIHLSRAYSTEIASQKLKFLVDNYKPTRWYWESVVAARKGLSVALIAALASYPVLQLQAVMVLFTGYLMGEEHFDPFLSSRRHAAECTSYAASLFTCNAMLAAYTIGDSTFSIAVSVLMIVVQVTAIAVFGCVLFLDYCDAKEGSKRGASRRHAAPTEENAEEQGYVEASSSVARTNVPAGYVLDSGSGLYYSDESNLYLDPRSMHFHDPLTGRWLNPDTQVWYSLESRAEGDGIINEDGVAFETAPRVPSSSALV